LADVSLPDGTQLTLHCPNTGSMQGCAEPGTLVYYSLSGNLKRKYPHTWELAKTGADHWICVNTSLPNKVVGEALLSNSIPELMGYQDHLPEVKYGSNSRIDWLLKGHPRFADCYIEVKNVTLLDHGQGYFPDAVSARATKHLQELAEVRAAGYRAVIFFLVSHSGISSVAAAKQIDPKYAEALGSALQKGVEAYAYRAQISAQEIVLTERLALAEAAVDNHS
jgi:sugar fermentation stimulation protein A